MRQGSTSRRSRGRNNNRKQSVPLRMQTFDSNGPDVRIRGNAYQVFEKYLQLARDANASGHRIKAESCYQHAEHYFRLINVEGGQNNRQNNRQSQQNQRQSGASFANNEAEAVDDDTVSESVNISDNLVDLSTQSSEVQPSEETVVDVDIPEIALDMSQETAAVEEKVEEETRLRRRRSPIGRLGRRSTTGVRTNRSATGRTRRTKIAHIEEGGSPEKSSIPEEPDSIREE